MTEKLRFSLIILNVAVLIKIKVFGYSILNQPQPYQIKVDLTRFIHLFSGQPKCNLTKSTDL